MSDEEVDQRPLHDLLKARGRIKAKITRFKTFLESFDATTKSITHIQTRLEGLKEAWTDFESIQSRIELLDESDDQRENIEEFYYDYITEGTDLITSLTLKSPAQIAQNHTGEPASVGSSSTAPVSLKLPEIPLATFSGNFQDWASFENNFMTLIHNNSSLNDYQKFHYLTGALRGEAIEVIENIEVTAENYEDTLALLRDTYSSKKMIKKAHVSALFKIPTLQKDSFQELNNFINNIQKHVRALANLGEEVGSWDTLLIQLFSSKLDKSTEREWETKFAKLEEVNFDHFMNFLKEKRNVCRNIESNKLENPTVNKFEKDRKFTSFKAFKRPFQSTLVTASRAIKCHYCNESHSVYCCRNLLKIPVKSRMDEIKRVKLCANCLRPGHNPSSCESKPCRYCHKKHNSILHVESSFDKNSSGSSEEKSPSADERAGNSASTEQQQVTMHAGESHRTSVLLFTAVIKIFDSNGKEFHCRALLDNGSQSNFMTKNLFDKLKLASIEISLPIAAIEKSVQNITIQTQTIIKSMYNAYERKLQFLIIDRITDKIPNWSIEKANFKIPSNLKLSDPNFHEASDIDLLLGAGVFWELLCVGQINTGPGQPILQKSKLGWLVSGPIALSKSIENKYSCNLSVESGISEQLERFWLCENLETSRKLTKEEELCEKIFVQSTEREIDGRFIITLPAREEIISKLGESKKQAVERFLKLEKRLEGNEEMRKSYCEFMLEYRELGHMNEINDCDSEVMTYPCYYLPHHGVFKNSSLTTKLRVVFDASAKSDTGISLNDALLTGPTIQSDLFSIVIRFRKHKFVFIADIEKMYRQILVTEKQRNLQRIVWRDKLDEPIRVFQLNTLTYGTSPASFVATRCLRELSKQFNHIYPNACKAIDNDFYMDDLLTGSDTVQGAICLKNEINAVLERGRFRLRKWVANDSAILADLDLDDSTCKYVISDKVVNQTLGLTWNSDIDSLQITYNPSVNIQPVTKRVILSTVAKIFDPLGLVGPVTVKGKMLLQQLWQLKSDWDESVPMSIHTEWIELVEQLSILPNIVIPRFISSENPIDIQIHGFSDASSKALGACVYLRTLSITGQVKVSLICSKSRIAPLRTISLPKLELNVALLLAQLIYKVKNSLQITVNKTFYWCDSKIVLAWIAASPHQWKTYVSNRITEIQDLSENGFWMHVSSNENPADIISGGCTPEKLVDCEMWWSGPSWLTLNEVDWPSAENYILDMRNVPEYKEQTIINLNSVTLDDIFVKFSSLTKLNRVMAYVLRFVNNCKFREKRISGPLTLEELNSALMLLTKHCQKSHFDSGLRCIESGKRLPKDSKLITLNPLLDEQGILRVGGRIAKSNANYDQKFPIVLPSNHPLTKLIIINEHIRNFHAGTQLTLAMIRLVYWPLKGHSTVKKFLSGCVTCFRSNPRAFNSPLMGELPKHRLTPVKPFYYSGVDYAGPFLIKEGKTRRCKIVKCYLCVFVCLVTKAVHLEVSGDMSTESFLNTLKRFIARRGVCKFIYSDNGGNFIGANNELKEICKFLMQTNTDSTINKYLTQNHIIWKFIPARSPHMGGLWEAAVKSAKRLLKRSIGDARLTFEDLSTVFAQIESILNSRPLVPLSDNPNDFTPLTPNHFLIGDVATMIPETSILEIPPNRLNHYQRLQSLVQNFWKRWSTEYLSTLQQRSKWTTTQANRVKVGDLVLLKNEDSFPNHWPLGRVTELHPGADGVVRVVSVKTISGTTKRALSRVCPLPAEEILSGIACQGGRDVKKPGNMEQSGNAAFATTANSGHSARALATAQPVRETFESSRDPSVTI